MRRALSLSLFIILISCFSLQPANAQVGITTMPFLQINNHARSMGMAGATVAMRHHPAGAHLNPAVIGNPGHIELSGQFDLQSGDPSLVAGTHWLPGAQASLVMHMPSLSISGEKWSVGYQLTYFNLGDPDFTIPVPEESYRSFERAHTITFAYHWNRYLSTGISRNYIKSQLSPLGRDREGNLQMSRASTETWDFGLYGAYPFRYKQGFKVTPSLGWSLTDYGSEPVSYYPISMADPLPMMMRLGVGVRIQYESDGQAPKPWLSDKDPLQVGLYRSFSKLLARHDSRDSWEALTESWDTYTVNYNGEPRQLSPSDQIMHQVGLELVGYETVSLRYGYHWEHEMNGDRRYHTIGLGLQHGLLKLDYVRYITVDKQSLLNNTSYFQFAVSLPIQKLTGWVFE